MANTDKDILITPNRGSTNEPKIEFKGASSSVGPSTITATIYPTNNGTLSFDGTEGSLFSIANNLTTGSIFSVNPISGIPIIDVNADRTIALNPYGGNTGIGLTNPSYKLDVNGTARFSGQLTIPGNNSILFGPNSTWSRYLRIGGNGWAADSTTASVVTTDGNLHLDAADANHGIYLNWYGGTNGTFFGNGATGQIGRLDGSGNFSVSGTITGTQITSNIANGTAPFVVSSTTKVTNLNADYLDDQTGSYYLDYNNFTNTPTIGNGTITVEGTTGLTGSGSFTVNQTGNTTVTLNHADTSSQASVDNSNGTVIQDVTLDTYGHVTGLASIDLYTILKPSNDQNQVNINSPASSSGSWTTASSNNEWGNPKFDGTFNEYRYADFDDLVPRWVQYNIPAGMKSAWISQLTWSSGGYVDIHGIQSDGKLVFLRRINTRQTVENSDEGVNHDGSTVTFAASGLDDYSAIRFTVQSGRFHLTGLSFSTADNEGTEGVGMVHPAQISHQGSGSGLAAETATTLETTRTIWGQNFNGSANVSGTITGATDITATGTVQGTQLISTVATGTAPLTVSSTTLVTNLNADLLDGLNSATANTASTIVARDASGNFSAGTITSSLTGAASLNVLKSGDTMTGQLISTKANSTTTGGGQIYLNGATGNRIDFNQNGVAAPAFTTRSAGTKLVLYPSISSSAVDYAFGIDSNTMWFSVPQTTSRQFKWYAGTTNIATLSGGGNLTATGEIQGTIFKDYNNTSYYGDFGNTGTSIVTAGNIGVKTTSPLQALDVRGNFLLAADATTATHITQKPYTVNGGTLSWEGSAGQLFSITNNLTSGSIFSVNDVSGIPSIDVDANGTILFAPYGGNIGVGTLTPTQKLHVVGSSIISGSLGLGVDSALAKLHTRVSTPTSIGSLPSGVTGILDSSSNNYLLFRNTADNGTYSGIAMQDNNVGGYVIFGNAGGGGDLLYLAGYGGGQLQYGTADSINPSARTTVASWNSTGLQINSGDLRAPIFRDSDDTDFYLNPATDSLLRAVTIRDGGLKLERAYANNSIWFAGGTDNNHVLWNDYYGGPGARGGAGSGFDGMKWNTYKGIYFKTGQNGQYNSLEISGSGASTNDHQVYLYGANDEKLRTVTTDGIQIQRDLYISGSAGGNYGNRLIVGNTDTSYILQDGSFRPTIQAHGQYPVVSLNNTETSNSSHGPTLQFTCNGTGNQFVIGTNGTGTFLSMGYSANTDWNPHNGIAGYNGTSFFHANSSGNIGLGAGGDWGPNGGGDPGYNLHFVGSNNATNGHAAFFDNRVNGANNGSGFLFRNQYGNHSWGIVAEYRVEGAPGTDRPSILFSTGYNSNTWSVGYGSGSDDNFRINYDHGHRNTSWGTTAVLVDRSSIMTVSGEVRAPIFRDTDNTSYYGDFGNTGTSIVTAGNIGAKTTSPLQALDVRGNFLLAADATTATHITQKPYTVNGGTLSWEGSEGQLFSIANNLTTGSIFSVNPISGIPIIDVNADRTIALNPYGGNTGIGLTNPSYKLDVNGTTRFSGASIFSSNISLSNGYIRAITNNQPAILSVASGTASSQASFAIQQETAEGWTGIFVDYEPNTGWGLYHDNPNNYFCITSEISTGSLRSFTVPSRSSGNRTAYEKIRFDQNNGNLIAGGSVTAASFIGNAATATNISNSGTVTLASATESNSIYVSQPSYTTNQPVKLLNFDWYGNIWSLGNIRSGSTPSNGFGVYSSGTERAKFTTSGLSVVGNVTATNFYGDGSNLTGITGGATLSASSGSQRVVLTSLTSGTMTTAATSSNLAFDSSSGTTLSLGVDVSGSTATPTKILTGNNFSNGTTRDKCKIYLYNSGTEQYGFSVGSAGDIQYHSNTTHDFYISNSKIATVNSTGLSATVFTSTSDITKKTNIQNITNAVELTKQINGVRFDWKETEESSAGVIAQEVEEVLPEIVHTNDEGIKSVNYNGVVGLLVEAIKEQQKQIDELKKELKKLHK